MHTHNTKIFIQTYGCQMNYSDTERLETILENLGFQKSASTRDSDLIIFNTCSVRQKAEDRVLGQMKTMHELKRKNENLLVGLTGCMVRKSSTRRSHACDKLIKELPDLDFVIRIEEIPKLPSLLQEISKFEFPDVL